MLKDLFYTQHTADTGELGCDLRKMLLAADGNRSGNNSVGVLQLTGIEHTDTDMHHGELRRYVGKKPLAAVPRIRYNSGKSDDNMEVVL